ncbi:hypothetical protein GCM10010402_62130 [Actinomadura luteofluorescens]
MDQRAADVCDMPRGSGAVESGNRITAAPAGCEEGSPRVDGADRWQAGAGRFRGAGADAAGPSGPSASPAPGRRIIDGGPWRK